MISNIEISKENNYIKNVGVVMVLTLCTSSDGALCLHRVS